MKNIFLLGLACSLGVLCVFKGANKSKDYYTINADTVTLQEGVYDIADLHLESYTDERLVIKGIGKVVLTSSKGYGIILDTLAAKTVVLENLSFQHLRYAITYRNPVANKDSLVITACRFEGCEAAFYIKNPTFGINNLIIRNSVVTGTGNVGELTTSQKGFFAFCPVQNALIQKDTITGLQGAGGTLRAIHVGVAGSAFNKYELAENLVEDITGGNPGEEQGIMVLGEGSAYIHHNTLRHIFHTIPGTNDVEGIYSKCLQTEIAFNVLEDVGDTEASITVKGSQDSSLVSTNIHDNTISFSPERDVRRKTAGIRTVKTKNLQITNNIIKGSQNPEGAINIKSDLKNSIIENVNILGNQLLDCLGRGIRITGGDYSKVSIKGNTITVSDKELPNYPSNCIQLQILKKEVSEQSADVIIEDNDLTSRRNNSLGVFIVRAAGTRVINNRMESTSITSKNKMNINGRAFVLQ